MVHCDQSSFSSFLLNLHSLPRLEHLEIRSSRLQFDGPVGDSLDFDVLISGGGGKKVLVESGTGLVGSNGFLEQLERFFFNSSQRFKVRVMFPAKVNGLHRVCCESFLMINILILVSMRTLMSTHTIPSMYTRLLRATI